MTTPSLQHQAMWLLEKRVALLGSRQKRHRVHRSTNLKGIVNFFGCDTGRVNILWVQKAAWPESRRPKDYGRDGRQTHIWVICAILTTYHQFDKGFLLSSWARTWEKGFIARWVTGARRWSSLVNRSPQPSLPSSRRLQKTPLASRSYMANT